jgi:hypothetical protein
MKYIINELISFIALNKSLLLLLNMDAFSASLRRELSMAFRA